jgi:pantoate--beta-alanine ligase
MTVFDRIDAWRLARADQIRAGVGLGVVPTMGALHAGHLSLVRRSRAENPRTLVTIFVNPTQFDDRADLERYPRPLSEDVDRLAAEGVDFVLHPSEPDLYPDHYHYRVTELERSRHFEGAHRPGHFDGVLTVVLKLLQIACADRAYFGEKDWQQLRLVQGMARAFFLPTRIVACDTVREPDGLALSSRNGRLSAADRARAPEFHRILAAAPSAQAAHAMLAASGFGVDYVEDVDDRGVDDVDAASVTRRRLGAVRLGGVRLIDNVRLIARP